MLATSVMNALPLAMSVAVDAVAVSLLAWVTVHSLRDRSPPNATTFSAVSGSLLLWAGFSLLSEFPHSWEIGANLAGIAQLLPIVFLPAVWLIYVLGYTGRGTQLTRRRVAVFVVLALPLVGAAATFRGTPETEEIRRSLASVIGAELVLIFVIYAYAAVVFLRYGWNHGRISKTQLTAQLGAISAPYAIGIWRDGDVVFDGVTSGLLVSGVLLVVLLRRYPVLTGFPKADYVARSRTVEALREAVVVVDWDGRILDANASAEELLGASPPELIGTPLASPIDGLADVDLSPGTTGTVMLQTAKGRRQFQLSVSGVEPADTEAETEPVARAVLFRDITDKRTREQRLSVLNRVLRHNVRNKLDVVLAHADHVDDDAHRRSIRDSVSDLMSVSQKARDAESVMTDSSAVPSTMDLVTTVREVISEAQRNYPDATISLSAPDSVQITSHQPIVDRLAHELVENAIIHSSKPADVDVTIYTDDRETPVLRVEDSGPGLPDHERQLLTETDETQLNHGLGVGLWFVKWAVKRLGAALAVERATAEGTVILVHFHGAVTADSPSAPSE
jgi:PAS domain S-box-containing protein